MLSAFSNFETYQDRKEKLAKAETYQRKYETDSGAISGVITGIIVAIAGIAFQAITKVG